MPLYEITPNGLRTIARTSFDLQGLGERTDLQRHLRSQIEIVAPDTLVISEEFCEWEDSRCRIDLLAIDKHANLVVIELKRTDDGGHMELQALRYAAMVSKMTFAKAVDVYAAHLVKMGDTTDPLTRLLSFLDWDAPREDDFAQDVRIILVSQEFGRELTSAVLWLNDYGLDIRCVRMMPYQDQRRTLIDVQQVLPLPESEQYFVRIRQKETEQRNARQGLTPFQEKMRRFWAALLDQARTRTTLHARVSPPTATWIGSGVGLRAGVGLNYAIGRKYPRVELYIATGDKIRNKETFDAIYTHKESIEHRFGQPLGWERLDDKNDSRIRFDLPDPCSIADESSWPALRKSLIDSMIRFDAALRPAFDAIKAKE